MLGKIARHFVEVAQKCPAIKEHSRVFGLAFIPVKRTGILESVFSDQIYVLAEIQLQSFLVQTYKIFEVFFILFETW